MKIVLTSIDNYCPPLLNKKVFSDHLESTHPITVLEVLDKCGLEIALKSLRMTVGHIRERRLLAVAYARSLQNSKTDPKSIAAVDVAERFANGKATEEELSDALEQALLVKKDANQTAQETAIKACTPSSPTTRETIKSAWDAAYLARDIRSAAGAAVLAAMPYPWIDTLPLTTADEKFLEQELRRVCTDVEMGKDPYPR